VPYFASRVAPPLPLAAVIKCFQIFLRRRTASLKSAEGFERVYGKHKQAFTAATSLSISDSLHHLKIEKRLKTG